MKTKQFLVNVFDNIKGVIFDCDGVLVDSEAMSCHALNIVFDEVYNIDIGNDYSPVLGTNLTYSLEYYLNKFNLHVNDLDKLAALKEKAYFQLAALSLTSFPNTENFIKQLISNNFQVAVASSGSMKKVMFSLKKVGLFSYFDTITTSSEVKNGKPAPDLFLRAAEKIQLEPKHCLVFEDSLLGVRAAVNAKMRVIGFPGSFERRYLEKEGAIFVENGYEDLLSMLRDHLDKK